MTQGYLAPESHAAISEMWRTFEGFTVRPVPSTVSFYERTLRRLGAHQRRVLSYGGTPEIRECLLRLGAAATIVDRSRTMVEAMGLLTSGGRFINPNEQLVEASWLDVPLPDGCVDIAIGDDAINMVDWADFNAFLATTARLLSPGGHFICHLLVQPDESLRRQGVADVLRDYRAGAIRSEFDLASRINFVFYDDETYRMGWQNSITGLRRPAAGNGDSDIPELLAFIERFRLCNSSFACPPRPEWERLVTRLFHIEDVFTPQEHDYCRFEPVYLLRKKA
jgi:SAM-dependent methyltransferase